MYEGKDRQQMRRVYLDAWQSRQAGQHQEPLARLISDVILIHPEYHGLFDGDGAVLEQDYLPESGQGNPFLHMGMHIAIREQLAAARPDGIQAVYQALCIQKGDDHRAEHLMMECLGEALWQAQRNSTEPDESAYLSALRRLI